MLRDPQGDDDVDTPRGAKVAERPKVHFEMSWFLPRCRSRKSRGLPAEEALAAIYRATLGWFEWYGCFPPALRAGGHGLRFGETTTATTLPLGLTGLAALGFILEVFVVEEVLFSRGKYKFC
jgi:hypothetical protein